MFESLLTQSSGHKVSPETLEMLGRKASQMFLQQGTSLNDAISKLVSEHPELGNEHIKRVVEFANNVTFQEMFSKSEDKNVHFDVADPGVVIRDVKDGGSPAHDGKTLRGGMGDYATAPGAGAKGVADVDPLAQVFQTSDEGSQEQVKVASASVDHSRHVDPFEDVYDTHIRLQAAREKIASVHETFDLLAKQAEEELYQAVKYETLAPEGAGLGGVVAVLEKVASSEAVREVLEKIAERLINDRIPAESLNKSLVKKAGKLVNWEHPVVQAWSGFQKAAAERSRSKVALTELDEHLAATDAVIKKHAGAMTTALKKTVGVRGKVPAGLRQRFPRK